MTRETFMSAVLNEVDRAYNKHGREPWGRHEFYGVIAEEFREMETEIFKGGSVPFDEAAFVKEIIHVAAMCLRYVETGDRYRGTVGNESLPKGYETGPPAFLRKIME